MGQMRPFALPIDGELDTNNPITDRPPGTLVVARDCESHFFGPRKGSLAPTRTWEEPGTAIFYDSVTMTSDDTYWHVGGYEDQQRDLGTQLTMDIWFRITDFAYNSGTILLYSFLNTGGQVMIGIDSAANTRRLYTGFISSSARGTPNTTFTMVGTTLVTAGSTQAHRHHVRCIRDGSQWSVYLDGLADAATSSSGTIVATERIEGVINGAFGLGIGGQNTGTILPGTEAKLKGIVYAALLRDGAYTQAPIEATLPHNSRGRGVHHYFINRKWDNGTTNYHGTDLSRYGCHPRIVGTNYTASGAQDNNPPASGVVQGLTTWSTRKGRTATAVMVGGLLTRKFI